MGSEPARTPAEVYKLAQTAWRLGAHVYVWEGLPLDYLVEIERVKIGNLDSEHYQAWWLWRT